MAYVENVPDFQFKIGKFVETSASARQGEKVDRNDANCGLSPMNSTTFFYFFFW